MLQKERKIQKSVTEEADYFRYTFAEQGSFWNGTWYLPAEPKRQRPPDLADGHRDNMGFHHSRKQRNGLVIFMSLETKEGTTGHQLIQGTSRLVLNLFSP